MTDRTVRVVLTAATQAFEAGMQKAQASAKKLRSEVADFGQEAKKALTAGDFKDLQGPLVAYGTAMTAIGAAVAKTGIAYNTLQQTSRAALTTLTGSAQAANAQMAQLDEFARTSPFAKDVFITAQQQMMAFGIEAEKVIPYLSGINDAVAAAGGSSQTLGEVAFVIAQIGAAGKITAQDLMQLGQRGINAAELIGSQMGKTGSQIRDDITAGTLDAGDALDALAAGMSEKFEGASANVKQTMAGAFDRVKAAWRDLTSSLTESAVGPEGGGWLVDATNGVADFLRMLESLPQPVKEGAGALSVITGAVALAGGGVLMAVPKFLELRSAISDLQAVSPRAASALGTLGRGAGATVGLLAGLQIVAAVSRHFRDAAPAADDYAAALKRVASAADEVAVGQAVDDLFGGVSSALVGNSDDLREAMGVISQYQGDIIGNLLHMNAGFDDAVDRFSKLDAQLASADTDVAAEAFDFVRRTAEEAGWSLDELTNRFPEYSAALNLAAAEAGLGALTTEELVAAMSGLESPLDTAALSAERWSEAVKNYHTEGRVAAETSEAIAERMQAEAEAAAAAEQEWVTYLQTIAGGSESFISLNGALDAAQAKHREVAETLAETSESGQASWEDFYDGTSVSIGQYLAELEKQIEAQNDWEANMLALSGRASKGLIDHLAQMGAEGAPLVAALVNATDAELSRMEAAFAESGAQSSMDWAEGLADGAAVWAALGRKMGDDVVREAAAEVAAGKATLQGIIDRYDLTAELDADTRPASQEVTDILAWVAAQRSSVTVSADTSAAESAARAAIGRIAAMSASVSVGVGVYHRSGLNAPAATGGLIGDIAAAYGLADGGYPRLYGGGYVSGPGTTTSDSVPTALSREEFVMRAWAASRIGPDALYYMNAHGELPNQRPQNLPTTYRPDRAVTSTASAHSTAGTTYSTTYNLHGREAYQALDQHLRDGSRRDYQTEGVHG